MIDDNTAQQLHQRSTSGFALSEGERAELDAWYAVQDEMERKILEGNRVEPDADLLLSRINEALAQLAEQVEQSRVLIAENQALHQEIAVLLRLAADAQDETSRGSL